MTDQESPGAGLRLLGYNAVIFDMDGVATDTASMHAAAWKQMFDEVLHDLAGPQASGFDIESDYRSYVDGRTREDGVRAFLASRQNKLPEARPTTRRRPAPRWVWRPASSSCSANSWRKPEPRRP